MGAHFWHESVVGEPFPSERQKKIVEKKKKIYRRSRPFIILRVFCIKAPRFGPEFGGADPRLEPLKPPVFITDGSASTSARLPKHYFIKIAILKNLPLK